MYTFNRPARYLLSTTVILSLVFSACKSTPCVPSANEDEVCVTPTPPPAPASCEVVKNFFALAGVEPDTEYAQFRGSTEDGSVSSTDPDVIEAQCVLEFRNPDYYNYQGEESRTLLWVKATYNMTWPVPDQEGKVSYYADAEQITVCPTYTEIWISATDEETGDTFEVTGELVNDSSVQVNGAPEDVYTAFKGTATASVDENTLTVYLKRSH